MREIRKSGSKRGIGPGSGPVSTLPAFADFAPSRFRRNASPLQTQRLSALICGQARCRTRVDCHAPRSLAAAFDAFPLIGDNARLAIP